jgi:hypothetical protein
MTRTRALVILCFVALTACQHTTDSIVAPIPPFISVPVRWCILEGSPLSAPGVDADAALLSRLRTVTWNIYNKASNSTQIGFRSAISNFSGHFPTISDPCGNAGSCPGELGDILDADGGGIASQEMRDAVASCQNAWQRNFPEARGMIALNIRRFVNRFSVPTITRGESNYPFTCNAVLLGDFCTNLTIPPNYGTPYVFVIDKSLDATLDPDDSVLAHELGHTLMLGHGDGIDNDNNGRYDQCCDNAELNSGSSLMDAESRGSETITGLQKQTARAVALITPGAAGPCEFCVPISPTSFVLTDESTDLSSVGTPSLIRLIGLSISENSARHLSSLAVVFSAGTAMPLSQPEFLLFLDTDDNSSTGGAPGAFGFPTSLSGTEVVLQLSSSPVSTSMWRFEGGTFHPFRDPRINVVIASGSEAESHRSGFSTITVLFSEGAGVLSARFRVQAVARDARGKVFDRLPHHSEDGALTLTPSSPQLPRCNIKPNVIRSERQAMLTLNVPWPSAATTIFLDNSVVLENQLAGNESASRRFEIPSNISAGIHGISVQFKGSGGTADCFFEVLKRSN